MRAVDRLPLAVVLAALLAAACQPAAPVAESKPRRRSFEESGGWHPAPAAAAPASASASGNASGTSPSVDAQAQQVKQTWEQAGQATNDADRQRLAGEALKQTREMAEQPSGHQ